MRVTPRRSASGTEQSATRPPHAKSALGREIAAIAWLLFAFFLAGAIVLHAWNLMHGGTADIRSSFGWVGEHLAAPLTGMFGWVAAAILPFAPAAHALRLFGRISERAGRSWLVFLLGGILLIPVAFGVTAGAGIPYGWQPLSGWWGAFIAYYLVRIAGTAGAWIAWLLLFSALMAATLSWNPIRLLVGRQRLPDGGAAKRQRPSTSARQSLPEPFEPEPAVLPAVEADAVDQGAVPTPAAIGESARASKRRERATTTERADQSRGALTVPAGVAPGDEDEIPPIDLLNPGTGRSAELGDDELRETGTRVVDALRTFRVESRLQDWKSGPVVTQFRIVPAAGVKVRQIANLANDLALAMKAASIRIVAPVPGIGAVGVEVPNPQREIVALRELLEIPDFTSARATLPIALGKDLEGRPVVDDLTKMPHLLIAGATGSGKSVCINTIITSLIYRHTPRTLRLVLIDPKMVELTMYNALPHLRHKVVTNNRDAAAALKWAVYEMEYRYELLAANGARNVQEFNRKVHDGVALSTPRDPAVAFENTEYAGGILPYIVIVIDELADLMMTVQGEVETPLAKLAQKARAIGIHLILATQRPSVNVITGLIKANFSSRIAFRVASQVDSRTILDGVGAESLLGIGDMLFLPPAKAEPARLQGAFISSEETERLTRWYDERRAARQRAREALGIGLIEPAGEEDILETVRQREALEAGAGTAESGEFGDRDKLFREAAEVVIQHQQGSTSLLQRRLKVGYGRAARIIDQLHEAGVLGPPDGSKPRDVLVGLDELDRISGPRV